MEIDRNIQYKLNDKIKILAKFRASIKFKLSRKQVRLTI